MAFLACSDKATHIGLVPAYVQIPPLVIVLLMYIMMFIHTQVCSIQTIIQLYSYTILRNDMISINQIADQSLRIGKFIIM